MKRITRFTALLLLLALVLSCAPAAQAGDSLKVKVKGSYLYSEARSMLKQINSLRTDKDKAWYIAKDNKKKVAVKGLKKLEYDYNLERVAMQRALEIAVCFSHTRPNGAAWSSLYPKGYNARGENIAYGYGSANAAFKAFAEEKEKYSGQGHRRNMLNKRFTRVGIGAVKVGNVMYWVQEFGCGGSKGSDGKRYKGDTVTVSESMLADSARSVRAEEDKVTLEVGSTVATPGIVIISESGGRLTLKDASWHAAKNIVTIKKQKMTGTTVGRTKLTASVAGFSVTAPVSVVAAGSAGASGGKKDENLDIIEEYDPALGTEQMYLLEEDECIETDD